MEKRLMTCLSWISMALAVLLMVLTLYDALKPLPPVVGQSVHEVGELPALYGFAEDSSINMADAEALDTLPGVGPVIAQRIIEVREAMGGFSLPAELLYVRGIGRKVAEKIMNALDEPLVELDAPADPKQILLN